MEPETRYARSGGVNIAYQVVGEGPLDLLFVPAAISHLEWQWEEPSYAKFLNRLASFSRLILLDSRGTGLSDRVAVHELPTLEQRMDDIRAVMDSVSSHRAALFGYSEGGPLCALFAATYPARTSALVLYGAPATSRIGLRPTPEQLAAVLGAVERNWGQGLGLARTAPSRARDPRLRQWYARLERLAASPGAAVALTKMILDFDIRHVLPAVRVPTLVLHRAGDQHVSVDEGRYYSQQISGARYVELPGIDHMPWVGDADAIIGEVQEFLTGVRPGFDPDRVLATILFTDIVGSTVRAARLGDHLWGDLLQRYYAVARKEIERFRGREIKTTGDGFLATFDGPARGIRCACSIVREAEEIGVQIRAGLHTGECQVMGEDVGGIAVHIGSRVASIANAGEVLVSSTVKDLVAGSGLEFDDRGHHHLKGVPDQWQLFAVRGEADG